MKYLNARAVDVVFDHEYHRSWHKWPEATRQRQELYLERVDAGQAASRS